MPKFRIAVTFRMWGEQEVEADTLEEAEEKVLSGGPLPEDREYIDDSLQLDPEWTNYGEAVE